MSRHWLSSDWHLGHRNIAGPNTTNWEKGFRMFSGVEEMDDTIIDNINKNVAAHDTIWMLGDFSFGGHTKIPLYRSRIYCKNLHIILGNHDHHLDKYRDYFTSIQHVKLHTFNVSNVKIPVFMSHYSHRIWEGSHKGCLHAYGHSHSSLESLPYGKSMDVGVDNAYRIFDEYRPFLLEEFVDLMAARKIAFPDHHDEKTNVR